MYIKLSAAKGSAQLCFMSREGKLRVFQKMLVLDKGKQKDELITGNVSLFIPKAFVLFLYK